MNAQVAIVGGGPCGLLTSLLLSRYGVKNVLFEKHPGISFHPKAMGTTRRTAEVFRQLGLLEPMMEKDVKSRVSSIQVWLRSLAGEEFGRSPLVESDEEYSPCEGFNSPQPHIEAVLKKAVEAEDASELLFGCQVTGLLDVDEGVEVSFQDRNTGENGEIRVDWVIAADGAASPVREELGIGTNGPGDRGHFLNVYFRADYSEAIQDRESLLYSLLDSEYYELLVAVNGRDEWLMHHFLQPGESEEQYTPEVFEEIIREVSGQPEIPVEVMSISPWVMSPKVAEKWRAGRVLLTGDASARMSPAGGLGMNTGLQSAANLAWKLAAVLHGQASEGLLDTYFQERIEAVQFIFANAEGNADEVFEIVGLAMSGDWEGAKEKIHHSRRTGSGMGVDLGLNYSAGALVPDDTEAAELEDPVNEYKPDGRPGHRAPHISIVGGNGETSSIDLYGGGFVLLCGPQGGAWMDAVAEMGTRFSNGISIRAEMIGVSFDVHVKRMLELYGISDSGAVLVRPDGVVAIRWIKRVEDVEKSLSDGLDTVLSR